jgi:hypothetical protein
MKHKRAAMEMSVGTMVTIVLLMVVLVLGIFFIQKIFGVGTNAIDSIDSEVLNQIERLFSEEGKKIAVYPTARDVSVKKGDDPKGFAFSIKNTDREERNFTYTVTADDVSDCGRGFTVTDAENFLLGGSGRFPLGPGNTLDLPRLVKLSVPESAIPCTIIYNLQVDKEGSTYTGAQVFVTIK